MGSSNQAQPLGRADFSFCFNLLVILVDRALYLNIYVCCVLILMHIVINFQSFLEWLPKVEN